MISLLCEAIHEALWFILFLSRLLHLTLWFADLKMWDFPDIQMSWFLSMMISDGNSHAKTSVKRHLALLSLEGSQSAHGFVYPSLWACHGTHPYFFQTIAWCFTASFPTP